MKKQLLSLLLLLPALPGLSQTCSNLVANGDFESGGNTPAAFGFTSSYQYVTPTPSALVPEGRYTLVNTASAVHNSFANGGDHTSGTGRMMVINGSVSPNTIVWAETISVMPNTTYYFSTWVKNVVGSAPAVLQFSINGTQIGSNFSATGNNTWQRFFTSWNSGANTSAVIRLIDQQTAAGGNDFAIDDVFFTDVAPLTAGLTAAPATCSNAGDGTLTVNVAGGVGPFSYAVNGGTFTAASGNPFVIAGLNQGTYSVVLQDACGNTSPAASATVTVVDNIAPTFSASDITASNDAGLCGAALSPFAIAYDNCAVGLPTGVRSDALGLGDTYPVGVTTITWNVMDAAGNAAQPFVQTITVSDNEAPAAICMPATVTLVNGMVSISGSDVDGGSTDNCGIASLSVSPSTFTCANIGANNVTLTVTDVHGNQSTCNTVVMVAGALPTCSIAVAPANAVFTGGVPTNIYLGYGPQSATIDLSTGGGSSFTYAWSGPVAALSCTTCQDPVFTPTAPGIYTYTVLVTNENGCTTSCTVTFCVRNVAAPSNGNNPKVFVCHNGHTISVSTNAVASHLAHPGDALGSCGQTCGSVAARSAGAQTSLVADEVSIYPNPNTGSFTVSLPYFEESATITVTDVAGKTVATRIVRDGDSYQQQFDLSQNARGVYFVQVRAGELVSRSKVVIR